MKSLAATITFTACIIMLGSIVMAQELATPSGLAIEEVNPSYLKFSWNYSGSNHDGFVVERSDAQAADFEVVADLTPGALQYEDNSISRGESYTYRVKAYNSTQESAYSQLVSGPPALNVKMNDMGKIGSALVSAHLQTAGVPEFDFLKVQSADRFAALELGYTKNGIYAGEAKNISDHQHLEITIKDLGGTDWKNIQFRLNGKPGISIGDYIMNAETLEDGWLRVKVPLSAFTDSQKVQFISFPHAPYVHFGIREIQFTGADEAFQWIGDQKFDNSRKENVAGHTKIVYKKVGVQPQEIKLNVVSPQHSYTYQKKSMPWQYIKLNLSQGQHLITGTIKDANGTTYQTDTIVYSVPAGLKYHVEPVSCYGGNDGKIEVVMDGGTPPYAFSWSNGTNSEVLSGLSAGIYSVEVVDAEGKTASAKITIDQPHLLSATLGYTDCTYKEANLEINGGKAPYSYSIDNGPFQTVGITMEEVWRLYANYDGYEVPVGDADTDRENNVYFAGAYDQVIRFQGDSVGIEGKQGIYLASVFPDGTFKWKVNFIGGRFADLAVDQNGNSVLAFNVWGEGELVTPEGNIILKENGYIARFDKKGNLLWIHKMIRGVSNLGVDAEENIYVAGKTSVTSFEGTSFGSILGSSDLYLAKYSNHGSFQWVKPIKGKNDEISRDMHVTSAGDIFLTGGFETDIAFGGLKLYSTGLRDTYIAKYDNQGNAIWANLAGGNSHDDGKGITVDDYGNVYVIAHFRSTTSSFGGSKFASPVMVLAKLNGGNGAVQWAQEYVQITGMPTFDMAYDVITDFEGNIRVTGEMAYSWIRGKGGFELYYGSYILTFDPSGSVLDRRTVGDYTYGQFYVPLATTNDNHLIYVEYFNGFSIIKRGPAMARKISFDPASDHIVTIQDANHCSFVIDGTSGTGLEQPYICYLTTAANDGNKLVWEELNAADVIGYNIYRQENGSSYQKIGAVPTGYTEFLDADVHENEGPFTYKLSAVNSCGVESAFSDSKESVYLTVEEEYDGEVILSWSVYEGLEYDAVAVYGGSLPNDMQLIERVSGATHEYSINDPVLQLQYFRIALEGIAGCNTQGVEDIRRSSITVESNMANLSPRSTLVLYPNPGKDRVNLRLIDATGKYNMVMMDSQGRVVRKSEGLSGEMLLHREELPPGLYNITVRTDAGESMSSVVVFQ